MSLRSILEELALHTYNRLEDAQRYQCPQGEETITDILLLDLARKTDHTILVYKTNRNEESWSGVDWEWWIGDGRTGWVRFAVQAKKLSETGLYPKVSHRNRHGAQIDLLERYAAANGCTPLYCLYNFPPGQPQPAHWHCCQKADETQYGCTLVSSRVFQKLIAAQARLDFDTLHRHRTTIPWRCILCRRGLGPFIPKVPVPVPSPSPEPVAGRSNVNVAADDEWIRPRVESELPAFLVEAMLERKSRRFRPEELPEEMYARDSGAPKRIAVLELTEQMVVNSDPARPDA